MEQISPILQDLDVLICRPQPSASELARVFSTLGAQTKSLPCIQIETLELDALARQQILDLDRFHSVIVTSQHAARSMVSLVDEYWAQPPVEQKWFGMGPQTNAILRRAELDVVDETSSLTSEAFLDAYQGQFAGQRVLLCKGEGGRELLQERLEDSVEQFESLDLYRRVKPVYQNEELVHALRDFDASVVVALSAETLENLASYYAQIGEIIGQVKLVVSSERVAKKARSLGFASAHIADNLRPIDLVKAVRAVALGRS